ncbi:tryptophan synthase beta chain [bacterium BMS3Abin07]|nr:tryptophan synthase beta chain [bacterium BMS3Abin07]GBE33147.1 tryptophan synthase beta chain [bacterium BMS3Bbin05]HDL20406.1 TrpB-like pyridoxal phosphate-dependent enzyme [Nitrospirota bacterium]HDO22631.1 TrpB-like pyridoxal phosphate-dependent enzyme [Nitrospirota bacterium]HDZ87635.1 TrpB-like pyridoxal phosphate-dependent enzyme [Nitrospirota bacterium]
MRQTKIILPDSEIPTKWYNIMADMPNLPQPPLHPGTKQPIGPEDLSAIFPMALIEQEVSQERWIDIPGEVLDIYSLWRPTPLYRAHRLEKALGTPAKIYYKYEGVSPAGSHKPNTSIPQAYYNKAAGIKRIATETGAGQWGSSMALAGSLFGIDITVYMVKVSFNQKPYRRITMETWGAEVHASPSTLTESGKKILEGDPDCPGSLGIAISEAVEDAATHDDTNYALGSVLNHVLLHQTVIGLEAKKQFELAGDYPDVIVGCCGGGSNLAGASFPFIHDKINGKDLRVVAVEPQSCPTLTKGEFRYDFGDTAGLTPLQMMYTLGHDFVPPGIHAGGLRYHADAPLMCQLYHDGIVEAVSYGQTRVFEAALQFANTEGIIPAPETAHAIRGAIDEAIKAREEGKEKTIFFNLSGHGYLDLQAYADYLDGKLTDYAYPEEKIKEALSKLPVI